MTSPTAPQAVQLDQQPTIVQALEPETTPDVAPIAAPATPVHIAAVRSVPRSTAAPQKVAAKSGPSVGLIAGAAVAAVTVLAAGVSIFVSGKKSSNPPAKKQATRPSAPARPAKPAGTKASGRTSLSSAGGSRPASRSSTAGSRRSSAAGSRPSSRASSSAGAAPTSTAAAPAAAKKATAKAAPAAAAPTTKASAADKPKAPAATPTANGVASAAAAAAAAPPAPAAAAPTVEEPTATPPEPQSVPASSMTAAASDKPVEEPAAPATPAPAVTAATPTAGAQDIAEVDQQEAQPAAAAQSEPEPAPVAQAVAAEPVPAQQAEAAVEPQAAAAEHAPAEAETAAPAAEEQPAEAVAASAPADESAAATSTDDIPTLEATAADQAATNGVQPEEGDEGLIELAEGETLPVVDEAGNQLGTLHADGRVLDESGTEIGALDEEGNVVLYEQQQGEEPQLSPAEEEAEQLMRQAAVAWNVQHNKEAAERFQRKALEVVTKEPGAARPEIVAEVASSLADMLYAGDKLIDAKEALQVALDAAEAGGQHALYIKLSNNMGAVLRKQELHEEGKALHQKAMQVALDHFGVAHATTTLARGNLVDALDQLGDRETARKLLTDSMEQIKQVAEEKEAAEAAKGGKPTEEETAAAVAAALKDGQSPELAAMLAIDSSRAYTAAVRVQIELARLEMKDKQFERAVEVLEGALDMAKNKFGDETAEASSVMAALATCHRQAGNIATSVELFQQLYEINERQSGGSAANQSGIMLARTLSDVLQEAERNEEALQWAEKALNLMQQLAGVRVHPALEPYFNLVIELKNKTGDEAGAEDLRKQMLKAKLQMAGQAQRAGPNSKAAAGKPPSGQAASKAGAAGKQGAKRGGKRK